MRKRRRICLPYFWGTLGLWDIEDTLGLCEMWATGTKPWRAQGNKGTEPSRNPSPTTPVKPPMGGAPRLQTSETKCSSTVIGHAFNYH